MNLPESLACSCDEGAPRVAHSVCVRDTLAIFCWGNPYPNSRSVADANQHGMSGPFYTNYDTRRLSGMLPSYHLLPQHPTISSTSGGGTELYFSSRLHRNEVNDPPPLIARRPVPLPALSDIPITLHPLLAYTRPTPGIIFKLGASPSAAILSPTARKDTLENWRHHAAMHPRRIGSLTIRIAEVLRPVVVFPATLDDSVVTIDDVLEAVCRSVRVAVQEKYRGSNVSTAWQQAQRSQFRQDCHYENSFGGGLWWAGLHLSPGERDVWILHTRHDL